MNDTSSIQVIDRMVALLDSLAQHGQTSLKVLAAETGLHSSTTHRILSTLVQHNWVMRSAEGGYQLAGGLLRYARQAARHADLCQLALPLMSTLRDATGETVNLTVREGDDVVYIERAVSRHPMRVEQLIGSRAPLHATAAGKLLLADAGEPACVVYATRTGLPAFTPHTITDISQLINVITHDLPRGYAFDNEETELGIACIAVLIRDNNGRAVAGLSISTPRERRRDAWTQLLLRTGQQISSQLGF